MQPLAADVLFTHGVSTDLDTDLAAWPASAQGLPIFDSSMGHSLDGSFPPDFDLECRSASRSLTFRVAVLPPVLGPVMITALVSGLTHTSIATGPFASTAASSWFSAANIFTLTTHDMCLCAAVSCCNANLHHSELQFLRICVWDMARAHA